MEKDTGFLSGFFTHGVTVTNKITGDEYISDCPFCQKEGHFYINLSKKVWICHRCDEKGNYLKFLELTSEYNQKYLKPEHLNALALDRELPVEAFKGYGIGFDGSKFTFPTFKPDGTFVGLRYYQLGRKMMNTKSTEAALFNAIAITERESLVYLLEGESDAIAFNWLLKRLNKSGTVVGVPGAGIFLDEWIQYFYGKDVVVLYDNDDPGQAGATKVYSKLESVVNTIRHLHWWEDIKESYDIRDLVKDLAIKHSKPKTCFKKIENHLHPVPAKLANQAVKNEKGKFIFSNKVRENSLEPISFKELVSVYQKHFHMPDITPIKVLYAAIYANKIQESDMIWMFLVGPPSSLKTELIQSLKLCPEMELTSVVTPQAFISGYRGAEEESFLKLLNGRCWLIKDFTTTLTMPYTQKDAIFGQLRDIYDGEHSKKFGFGLKKFQTRFGIIAGVTNAIEKLGMMNASLGERFLRYDMPLLSSMKDEERICDMVIDSIGKEKKMREDLQFAARRFLGTHTYQHPEINEEMRHMLKKISRFTAYMRGFVDKDFHGDITYRPGKEGPGRITRQLAQMAIGLAIIENKSSVGLEEIEIVKKIALSTTPSLVEGVVKTLYYTNGVPMKLPAISEISHLPVSNTKKILDDLVMLNMVRKKSSINGPSYYQLKDKIKILAKTASIYPNKKIKI